MTDIEIIKVKEDEIIVNALKILEPFEVRDIIAQMEGTINRQQAEIDILIRKKETLRDEIAEQQAEIERLKYILECEEAKYDKCAKHFYKVGVKDFAERLKDMHKHNTTSVVSLVTVFDNINKLLEEMEREDNA